MPDRSRFFDVDSHLERVRECARSWRGLPLPTATPKDQRYPLVYPRDSACIARAYDRLLSLGAVPADGSSEALHGTAAFLAHAQGDDGLWGQRYDLDGKDRSIYPQEDNTAHAVSAIARHVRHERERGRESPMETDAFDAMRRGLDAAWERLRDRELGLVRSTTSVHESAIERGFTLWTNGAFVGALRIATDAAHLAGRHDVEKRWEGMFGKLREAVRAHLVQDGTFVRALTPAGDVDWRPDVTLLAPSYFAFEDVAPRAEERAVERLRRELWDPRLGLLQRYPPDAKEDGVHLHGGNGPYLSFSSWLAQRHAARGEVDEAQEVLDLVSRYAADDGDLPEHVSDATQFAQFVERELFSGRDFRKEFDPDVLLPGVTYAERLKEAVRMMAAYESGLQSADAAGDGVVRVALPHAWTHAEVAVAVAALADARAS